MLELILNLLEGEDTSVDFWFSVFHEIVDSFYGFDLGVDIGHEDHIFVVFMYSQAENSVLSLIGVFICQELLLGIWIDIVAFFPKSTGEENSCKQTAHWKSCWNNLVGRYLFVDGAEILSEKFIFSSRFSDSVHVISWEETGDDMYKSEKSLEWFLEYMIVVGFNLLQSLDIEDISGTAAQAIQLLRFHEFLIFNQLLYESEVTADSTHVGVDFELPVHFKDGIVVGSDTDIDEEGILGF